MRTRINPLSWYRRGRAWIHRRTLTRYAFNVVKVVFVVWFTIVAVYTCESRKKDDLRACHRVHLDHEFDSWDADEVVTLDDYLKLEDALFAEVEEKVSARGDAGASREVFDRYHPDSRCHPGRFVQDYNRTTLRTPDVVRGGALFLHGLTDSPYSLRHLADALYDAGYATVSLRLPGHGTVPAGLRHIGVADWMAAVKLAARDLSDRIGAEKPFYLVGYSNGGALSVLHSLRAVDDPALRKPSKVFLISPSIGVTRFAALAGQLEILSFLPIFEKAGWSSVAAEYDPFKYNSFPLNAGQQSYRLSRAIESALKKIETRGQLDQIPPLITFQSLVDTTVVVPATLQFYRRLGRHGHELVLFDVNRSAMVQWLMKPEHDASLRRLEQATLPYRLSVVTNRDAGTRQMVLKSKPGGKAAYERITPLDQTWPENVYSLSHVALPFPVTDPIYGTEPVGEGTPMIELGKLEMRGERRLLTVSAGTLLRLRCNPFFAVLRDHLLASVE